VINETEEEQLRQISLQKSGSRCPARKLERRTALTPEKREHI
jgi:hypothetical protein